MPHFLLKISGAGNRFFVVDQRWFQNPPPKEWKTHSFVTEKSFEEFLALSKKPLIERQTFFSALLARSCANKPLSGNTNKPISESIDLLLPKKIEGLSSHSKKAVKAQQNTCELRKDIEGTPANNIKSFFTRLALVKNLKGLSLAMKWLKGAFSIKPALIKNSNNGFKNTDLQADGLVVLQAVGFLPHPLQGTIGKAAHGGQSSLQGTIGKAVHGGQSLPQGTIDRAVGVGQSPLQSTIDKDGTAQQTAKQTAQQTVTDRTKPTDVAFVCDFYNKDGSKADMCGNAACCLSFYAEKTGLPKGDFLLSAGLVSPVDDGGIALQTPKPSTQHTYSFKGQKIPFHFINTGVPHAVVECPVECSTEGAPSFGVLDFNHKQELKELAQCLRWQNPENIKEGMNVSFFQTNFNEMGTQNQQGGKASFLQAVTFEQRGGHSAPQIGHATVLLQAVTFERGVEDFTLSCGTGALAVASVYKEKHPQENVKEVFMGFPGGWLKVLWEGAKPRLFSPVKKGW